MIVRVTKHIFNDYLKSVKDYALANTVSQLLNAFFGRLTKGNKPFQSGIPTASATPAGNGATKGGNKKAGQQHEADNKVDELAATSSQVLPQDVAVEPLAVTHHTLWKQIRDKVASKYVFDFFLCFYAIPGDICFFSNPQVV